MRSVALTMSWELLAGCCLAVSWVLAYTNLRSAVFKNCVCCLCCSALALALTQTQTQTQIRTRTGGLGIGIGLGLGGS